MKKISIIVISILFTFISNTHNAFADKTKNLDIDLSNIKEGDSFKVNDDVEYTVIQVENSNININNKKVDIYNFEILANDNGSETWRKYVKLSDICKDKNVCELVDDDTDIILKRTSPLNNYVLDNDSKKLDVYYRTVYYNDKKQFKSTMAVGNQFYNFNYNNDNEDGKFDKDGILTADVEDLTDKNGDFYVSLRFVTEALGAEVIWTAGEAGGNDTVDINFYDDESYCKNIKTSFENACKDIDDEKLDKIQKCNTANKECLDERCKQYILENINTSDLDGSPIEINYKYIDEKDNLKTFKANWEKKNIYFSSDKNIKGYGIILYNSVPLLIDIFNGIENENCSEVDKENCLANGNKWINDEEMIELNGKDSPYCAIDLTEQITTSASR